MLKVNNKNTKAKCEIECFAKKLTAKSHLLFSQNAPS